MNYVESAIRSIPKVPSFISSDEDFTAHEEQAHTLIEKYRSLMKFDQNSRFEEMVFLELLDGAWDFEDIRAEMHYSCLDILRVISGENRNQIDTLKATKTVVRFLELLQALKEDSCKSLFDKLWVAGYASKENTLRTQVLATEYARKIETAKLDQEIQESLKQCV